MAFLFPSRFSSQGPHKLSPAQLTQLTTSEQEARGAHRGGVANSSPHPILTARHRKGPSL